MSDSNLKILLEEKYIRYNNPDFINDDPICIPHMFSVKENIEISGFLTAMLAWGQRATIISKSETLMKLLDSNPYDFLMNAHANDLKAVEPFVHRTFNGSDALYFLKSLAHIYKNLGGLEQVFTSEYIRKHDVRHCLANFRKVFFALPHPNRTEKHIANIEKGASCKRLNMFLRWMIRDDNHGVDFGIWPGIDKSALFIPLDLHTGNTARQLGLLKRKQDDWQAVEELTAVLRKFDAADPVKYDFALFGMGRYKDKPLLS